MLGGLMIYWFVAALLIEGSGSRDFSNLWGPFLLALLAFAAAGFFKYGDMTDLDKKYQTCEVTVSGKKVGLSALESCTPKPNGLGYLVLNDDAAAFDKESVLQGHALWHIFSAFGMLCIFEFFTSLRNKSGSIRPWRN